MISFHAGSRGQGEWFASQELSHLQRGTRRLRLALIETLPHSGLKSLSAVLHTRAGRKVVSADILR